MFAQSNCFQQCCCCHPCCARPSPCPVTPSPSPTIAPITGGATAVSGTGSAGCTVVVTLPNGQQATAQVNANGMWRVLVPGGVTLTPGQTVSATQTCNGATPSAPVQATVGASPITRTVTGTVSPVVFNDQGLGPAFLTQFNITAELRASVNTPAPPSLTTTAVVSGTDVGTFTFNNVPVGSYVLYLRRAGYLFRTMAVTVTAQSPNPLVLTPPGGTVFNLFAGDVNMDGVVDGLDQTLLNAVFASSYPTPPYTPYADFNADGFVNALDRSILVSNFNRASANYPGQV